MNSQKEREKRMDERVQQTEERIRKSEEREEKLQHIFRHVLHVLEKIIAIITLVVMLAALAELHPASIPRARTPARSTAPRTTIFLCPSQSRIVSSILLRSRISCAMETASRIRMHTATKNHSLFVSTNVSNV